MNLLIDFGSIKTGGGVQLATNFLAHLHKDAGNIEALFILLPGVGPLSKIDVSNVSKRVIYYPDSYFKRFVFEMTALAAFIREQRINAIYTFFGAGLPRYKGVKSIVSVAYPIICYPDSKYWQFVPKRIGLKKKLINTLRRRRIRKADLVVTETKVMAERIIRYVGVTKSKLRVIPPSPSNFIKDKVFERPGDEPLTLLVLSGLDPHKNLWRLPTLAFVLEQRDFTSFKFLVSVTREEFERSVGVENPETKRLLNSYFEFSGAIPATEIAQVYEGANFLVNLSDLESYSNNYMEAWKSGLPLIVNDTDFARHICRKSAVYIDAHDIRASVDDVLEVFRSVDLQAEMAEYGKEYLTELPDADRKFKMLLDVITGA